MAAPLSWVFAAAAHTRRFAYDSGVLPSRDAGVLTVSVGGLEAGGSGKTPVAGWVLDACRELGMRPGLLTRGYGRSTRGLVMEEGAVADPWRVGDEPAMLARERGVPVAASEHRYPGAVALRERGCDVVVLDDGFSHRALKRDLDIVVLRGEAPLGNGYLLPAGTLRESAAGLQRAHVVWAHSRTGGRDEELLARLAGEALLVLSQDGPLTVTAQDGTPVDIAHKVVVAACGIARPLAFADTLERSDAELIDLVGFPDHVRYTPKDMGELARRVADTKAQALVVTAKDAVKLEGLGLTVPVWVARVGLEVTRGAAELRELLRDAREKRTA
ncbi:MAG TPA: tetraacyldisaccharide 4'-kinase [Myxococcota bacterium]|nr:tetraacyldisaccharide 4'-kinase [Myxococcota bacterium]